MIAVTLADIDPETRGDRRGMTAWICNGHHV